MLTHLKQPVAAFRQSLAEHTNLGQQGFCQGERSQCFFYNNFYRGFIRISPVAKSEFQQKRTASRSSRFENVQEQIDLFITTETRF